MALKDKVASRLSNARFWQLCLRCLTGFCVLAAAFIWISGGWETRDAQTNGRRFLIHLDTGAIEGKNTPMAAPESTPQPTPTPTPAPTPQAIPQPTPQSTPAAPESAAPAESPAATPAPQSTPAAPESPASTPAESPAATPSPESPVASTPAESPPQAASTPVAESSPVSSPASLADTAAIKPALIPLAPVKDTLFVRTANGNLPTIGPGGLKPWHYYAKPYKHKGHLPMIAIIVTGLGQNKTATDEAIRLPENISLSFSPYARDVDSWAHSARVAGHEAMIDIPLEPSNFPASDPGPYGLIVGKGLAENNKRLEWLMSRFQGYTGFVTPQNEVYTSNDDMFKGLLDTLAAHGLMLVVGQEPPRNETKDIIDHTTTANIMADTLVDEELSANSIQARLLALQKIASKRGYAVGIAQPYPLTMQQLQIWSETLEKNGFTLVPATFIAYLKFPT